MQKLFLIIAFCITGTIVNAQKPASGVSEPNKKEKIEVVDASCGQCQFGLKGKGCSLAVRTKGKAYFVAGTSIDEHGDAHAKDGFCEAIRKAEVQGKVVNDSFRVTYFKLLPATKTPQAP